MSGPFRPQYLGSLEDPFLQDSDSSCCNSLCSSSECHSPLVGNHSLLNTCGGDDPFLCPGGGCSGSSSLYLPSDPHHAVNKSEEVQEVQEEEEGDEDREKEYGGGASGAIPESLPLWFSSADQEESFQPWRNHHPQPQHQHQHQHQYHYPDQYQYPPQYQAPVVENAVLSGGASPVKGGSQLQSSEGAVSSAVQSRRSSSPSSSKKTKKHGGAACESLRARRTHQGKGNGSGVQPDTFLVSPTSGDSVSGSAHFFPETTSPVPDSDFVSSMRQYLHSNLSFVPLDSTARSPQWKLSFPPDIGPNSARLKFRAVFYVPHAEYFDWHGTIILKTLDEALLPAVHFHRTSIQLSVQDSNFLVLEVRFPLYLLMSSPHLSRIHLAISLQRGFVLLCVFLFCFVLCCLFFFVLSPSLVLCFVVWWQEDNNNVLLFGQYF